ncbi:hypothetical protein MCOR27_000039 [Pyricularia oryzae]|uniref:Rhodopsin domain-containing protein n=5 Tax=Pyricularia TaxID=48558 RepID=A0ABQ8NGB4_PYRGI|nr:uncharacterized protein MGG_01905 [Pyricularia oryzae 70-15]ELQ35501.1 hypothetical protein OOU_Y34scaffold00706g5 [Pyricularia oryzae Y34]KAH8845524.1 hypothetical protein MCOR01_002763 [Pyricularia oryzae]KAI6295658.1 hypothetical protein MCOR33_007516 [Pyricularia grisea]EHA46987.1 hypothetical protein MGG_01905 [Pyricularia oryzae 70-15]KAH9432975.1 hypothetical protein MCOR02_007647 [Pyricularia oryzae]
MSENKGPMALAAVIVISAVSTTFTAARLFTRGTVMGKLMLDDYLILAAVILGWMNVATFGVAVSHGFGQHVDNLTVEQRSQAMMWSIIGYTPGLLSLSLPKPAVVALLTKALNPSVWHKRILWSIAILCVTNLVPYITLYYAQCRPVQAVWDPSVSGTCLSKSVLIGYATYSSAFCAFADVYLSVYPAVVLSKLQMNIRKKIALGIALGLGSLSTIAVIYKITKLPMVASPDPTFDTVDIVIWTILEGSIIIIAACVPVLQPLVESVFGKRIFYGSRRYPYRSSEDTSDKLKSSKRTFGSCYSRQTMEKRLGHGMSKGSISLTTTVAAKGSQERIWEKQEPEGKIVVVDTVTVTVESPSSSSSASHS